MLFAPVLAPSPNTKEKGHCQDAHLGPNHEPCQHTKTTPNWVYLGIMLLTLVNVVGFR